MRQVVLSAQKGGISRLREKGGASPDTLFDLTDAYVTTAKTIKQRPGLTADITLTEGTVGLAAYAGRFYVFAADFVAQTDARVTCVVLRHPSSAIAEVVKIHFAQPFLGRLYVVAEFDTSEIFHYWVTNAPDWTASTAYGYLQQVQPTVHTGLVYEASNVSTVVSWSTGVTIVLGDERQPTTYNGFKYEAVAVTGTAPVKTSDVEPVWPTTEGQTIVEYSYGGTTSTPTAPTPTPTYPPDIYSEYGPFPRGYNPNYSDNP